ncbi:MAG: DMT family protein [Phycisphaerae bacterium]|nr:DMT family protein [Phycisphaerae bacterium]
MPTPLPDVVPTVLLLLASNVFMTYAWYGHLKFKSSPLWIAILVSWGIAFFEYCLQVPANRLGHGTFTLAQLKILQEVITLCVFLGFAWVTFKEVPRWNEALAMVLIVAAVIVTFAFGPPRDSSRNGDAVAPPTPITSRDHVR